MQYFKFALPLALASSAFANPLLRRDVCSSDSCIAAVTGKAALGDDGLRADHCKSFLATTVTPEAITETTTITGVEPETSAWGPWKREKVTVCPNEVPNYASACETAAYSSACSCFGYSGDSTKTLDPTTTTKTVYISATGVCSNGTSTKTVTVTQPSGVSSGVSTKTITVTVPSGGYNATFSGVFTSTVFETSSVCLTTSGLGSTTKSTSTVTTTSAVTTTVTATASGSTCPTTTATTSTVTVSGTTSTVTVSGTTSVITTTASASTCPTTTATTSTVTVPGSTSTVTATSTTTASASTCPTTTATTSTVTISGTTSTVTSTESASSCPTTSATTTVTSTETTTTTSTTTSSSDAQPTCLVQSQVDSFVSAFTDFLENTDLGYSNQLSGPYNAALALETFTTDFQDYSDSINTLAGFPLGGVTFDGVYAFNYGQGELQYPVYAVTTEATYIGCTFFTWHWTLLTYLGENRVISGINVFEVTDDLSQIKMNHAEFNSAAWLANINEALAAEAAAAATTTSADAATTTTADATSSTTDAATTTSSASGDARKRY